MKTQEYWQLRTEENAKLGDKTSAELLSSMQNVYSNSYKEIEKEIQAFYGRYATINGLSISEVQKRLNPAELKSAKEAIKQYYDFAKPEIIGPHMSKDYRDELRLLSAKAYMSRLEELKMNLKHEMIKLGVKENSAFDDKFKGLFEMGYNKATFDVNKFLKFSGGFESPTSNQLNKLINERWLGNNYSDRIWTNKSKLLNNLESTFLSGVARGQNALKIAKEMQANYDTAFYNCERLARTESQHILNEARMEAYRNTGVTEYEFMATLDEKTCPDCGALDGQHFNIKDKMEGANYPVIHPNCRCGTVPYFEKDKIDELFDEATRVARNEEGNIYYVPETMNYTQWLKMMSTPPKTIKDMDFVNLGWRIGDTLQPKKCDSIDGLYKMAGECRDEFSKDTEQMAKQFKELNPTVLKRDALKGKERIMEKLKTDQLELIEKGSKEVVYDEKKNIFHARTIRDIDGHTIVVEKTKDVEILLSGYDKNSKVIRIKNNFAKPSPVGYKDINMNLKMSNGIIVEVQLNTIPNIVAKENYGHALYEIYRSIAKDRKFSKLASKMEKAQIELYGKANALSDSGKFKKLKEGDNIFNYTYKPFEEVIKKYVKEAIPEFEKAKKKGVFDNKTIEHFEKLIKKLNL